jgi:hypothetical protein
MKATLELFVQLVKMGLVLAGAAYSAEVLISFVRFGERYQPAVDREHVFRSAGQLLIGAGVLLMAALVTLGRPIVEMLGEASAELGEWALAKRQNQARVRQRHPVGRAA